METTRPIALAQQFRSLPSYAQLAESIGRWGEAEGTQLDSMYAQMGKSGRTAWTTWILDNLRACAPPGLAVYPAKGVRLLDGQELGQSRQEYLLDLVWSFEPVANPEDRIGDDRAAWHEYRGLALGAEIEWHSNEDAFWADFIKLADVQAIRRVFIGQAQGETINAFRSGGKITQTVEDFLSGHIHFQGEVLVTLWQTSRPYSFVARLFDGQGRSRLLIEQ